MALGGASDVALASLPVAGGAVIEVGWPHTAGVRHPEIVQCELPDLPAEYAGTVNAAVAPAAAAYRRALAAAVTHAAADASFHIVATELAATKRRHRAIERYRIPALEEELRLLALRLEELERQERIVSRWAESRRRDGSALG
jgi:vacuolar-type H+-ATPase subunit D/Vma8